MYGDSRASDCHDPPVFYFGSSDLALELCHGIELAFQLRNDLCYFAGGQRFLVHPHLGFTAWPSTDQAISASVGMGVRDRKPGCTGAQRVQYSAGIYGGRRSVHLQRRWSASQLVGGSLFVRYPLLAAKRLAGLIECDGHRPFTRRT